MYNPLSTYRIQFNREFTFEDFEKHVGYFIALGIKTIYASPIFKAVPGSMHGYDTVSPLEINPEIGTIEQLVLLRKKLKSHGIGWIQDIVPNHMAFHHSNSWLQDVLKNGKQSSFYKYFDMLYDEKIMAPFLGKSLGEEIEDGSIRLIKDDGEFWFKYFENYFPVSPTSVAEIPHAFKGEDQDVEIDKDDLFRLLEVQHYRLCEWRETDHKINYRRFFTINGLICLNIQDDNVFDHYHSFIHRLIADDVIDGIRVDHIDGLYDPAGYLQRIRNLAGDSYIVVEKILQRNESLPGWPVQGTTGYDFLALVNNLFTDTSSEKQIDNYYKSVSKNESAAEVILQKKRNILEKHMNGELDYLHSLFSKAHDGKSFSHMKEAIGEFLVALPLYRLYPGAQALSSDDIKIIRDVFTAIKQQFSNLTSAITTLEKTILDQSENPDVRKFLNRCMQFSGPLMAKGFEDTFMYTDARFISHNEVGDSPLSFGINSEQFHSEMIERQYSWPMSMSATATHDTKRGEDCRARLNVLSELGSEWINQVNAWIESHKELKTGNCPSPAEEYFLYQTIVGSFPLQSDAAYEERFKEYCIKFLRESKINSSWNDPDMEYEKNFLSFVTALFHPAHSFAASLREFISRIADYGIINSLSQCLVKLTAPGIPDIYQGCEFYDFSFVDPDNRRAVDYIQRSSALRTHNLPHEPVRFLNTLWNTRYNGSIKQWLLHELLEERTLNADLFLKGEYIPLDVSGRHKEHILAYARAYNGRYFITVVPLFLYNISEETSVDWENTTLHLPEKSLWINPLDGQEFEEISQIEIARLFKNFPVACLKKKKTFSRSAGILMHVTSLPSTFGIGDLGPDAYRFADFLYESNQSYWQVLPLNQVDAGTAYSPYSSNSAYAGNELMISPELLVRDGLITAEECENLKVHSSGKVNFEKAQAVRESILQIAADRFFSEPEKFNYLEFTYFARENKWWLDDYSHYLLIRRLENNKPWYEWPGKYLNRDKEALEKVSAGHEDEINKIKFVQFLFFNQWNELKAYCNKKELKIIGDMPFYLSYDSADVWSSPGIFTLDKSHRMQGVAGVPPDYFSADGQLWGMPTYRWDILEENNYEWWIRRVKKNLEYFDLLRIDHFRAFDEYWEVGGNEKTAVNGTWKKGPGKKFFDELKKSVSLSRLIAEDLGDKMESVYKLKNEIGVPGMKVLLFGFGDNLPVSVDNPHNHTIRSFVYTGTHDNNTVRGWFDDELSDDDRKRLSEYAGHDVNPENVNDTMIRFAYASVGKAAIIPLQDLLRLGADSRMNTPAKTEGNWLWRLTPGQLHDSIKSRLRHLTDFYNRSV